MLTFSLSISLDYRILLSLFVAREKNRSSQQFDNVMQCLQWGKKKIILPTGDGMVIGFVLNPENPLKLGIQRHEKLRSYNRGKGDRDKLKVRIGLSAGPVFSQMIYRIIRIFGARV